MLAMFLANLVRAIFVFLVISCSVQAQDEVSSPDVSNSELSVTASRKPQSPDISPEAETAQIKNQSSGVDETTQATPQENLNSEEPDSNFELSPQKVRLEQLKKLRRIETLVEEVIPKVSPCIVSIGETASGVIVKPSGIVITASHVTRKAGRIVDVKLSNGTSIKGRTLGSNAANDTSAIQLIGTGPWPYLKTVSPDYTAQAGQWCVAFGYPLSWARGKPASARIGRITGQYRGKIVTDCPIMGGDSGGALVDLNGNLLGINSSVRLDVTQNLHVPIARYRDDWKYMMRRQDVDIVTATASTNSDAQVAQSKKKAYIGIYGESIHKSVRIRDVRRDSPAEKAGLLPEDVIWQIDETPIESFAELLKYLSKRKGGDKINVRINRFGSNLDFVVTLAER